MRVLSEYLVSSWLFMCQANLDTGSWPFIAWLPIFTQLVTSWPKQDIIVATE